MIITNAGDIPNAQISKVLGIVQGCSLLQTDASVQEEESGYRADDTYSDYENGVQESERERILRKSIQQVQTEKKHRNSGNDYSLLVESAYRHATERMKHNGDDLGADAIVNVWFKSQPVNATAREILVVGTAVALEK
jgi:uncharacterized protein YbjQ (UPF0145 family)